MAAPAAYAGPPQQRYDANWKSHVPSLDPKTTDAMLQAYSQFLSSRSATLNLIPPLGRILPKTQSINLTNAPAWADLGTYAPWPVDETLDSDESFANLMRSIKSTSVKPPVQGEGPQVEWTSAFHGQANSFGWQLFPVVYYIDKLGQTTVASQSTQAMTVNVIPFAVMASSQPYTRETLRGVTPNYVEINTLKVTPDRDVTIMIDASFTSNDYDLLLSVVSAALAFLPTRWAGRSLVYLTIAPWISDSDAEAHRNTVANNISEENIRKELTLQQSLAFSGASLGAACAGAIAGLPPMMMTGMLSSFGASSWQLPQQINVQQLQHLLPPQVLSRGSILPDGVVYGENYIDSVQDIDLKMVWAITHQTLLCFPFARMYAGEHTNAILERARKAAMQYSARIDPNTNERAKRGTPGSTVVKYGTKLSVMDKDLINTYQDANIPAWSANVSKAELVYTTQMEQSGTPFFFFGSFLLGCVNFAEIELLSCLAASNMYRTQVLVQKARQDYITSQKVIQDTRKDVISIAVKKGAGKVSSALREKPAVATKKKGTTVKSKLALKEGLRGRGESAQEQVLAQRRAGRGIEKAKRTLIETPLPAAAGGGGAGAGGGGTTGGPQFAAAAGEEPGAGEMPPGTIGEEEGAGVMGKPGPNAGGASGMFGAGRSAGMFGAGKSAGMFGRSAGMFGMESSGGNSAGMFGPGKSAGMFGMDSGKSAGMFGAAGGSYSHGGGGSTMQEGGQAGSLYRLPKKQKVELVANLYGGQDWYDKNMKTIGRWTQGQRMKERFSTEEKKAAYYQKLADNARARAALAGKRHSRDEQNAQPPSPARQDEEQLFQGAGYTEQERQQKAEVAQRKATEQAERAAQERAKRAIEQARQNAAERERQKKAKSNNGSKARKAGITETSKRNQ